MRPIYCVAYCYIVCCSARQPGSVLVRLSQVSPPQVAGGPGEPGCGEEEGEEVEEEGKEREDEEAEGEEGESVIRLTHRIFNTTLHPLVAGVQYQGSFAS